jgi:hypothetical protein
MLSRFHPVRAAAWCVAIGLGLGVGGWWVNAAEGQSPAGLKFTKRCLLVSPNEGCAVADVDRDGKPDAIAGTHWFAAPDFIPRPVRDIPQKMVEFYSNNGDHAYDVDGDGWVDVISGGWLESEIYWYKNPGKKGLEKGWKWEPRLLMKARGENEAFDLHDFDGDGVPEIFVNCWTKTEPVVVWKLAKAADGQPTLKRIVLGASGGGHGYAFGDVNGDGREDVLVETGWYERPEGDVLAKPWKFHPETALPHPSCPFLAVDLAGKGRADLIWGKAHDYGLYWWEQGEPKPDGTTTWKQHLIDDSWSQVHCIVWADLDGDGKPEVVTGKRMRGHGDGDPGSSDPEVMYYYKWDGAARKFTRYVLSPPGAGVGTGMQIRVADLNGDGRPDILVSGKTGTYLLFNEGLQK